VRRSALAIKEAARSGKLFVAYNKAADTVQADFRQWTESAPQEDFAALVYDTWEVAHRAGRKPGPKPSTPEEASAFLGSLQDTLGEAACVALMVLWRRHRQGSRYFSPFKKESHD
jgi:hypothetical protein